MNDDKQIRGSVSLALHSMRDNSESAVEEIWKRFFPRLVRVAHGTLRRLPHRQQDANDAAQSAFISFWKSLSKDGVADVLDRNTLWRLLTTITVRKARRVVRDEFAQKRGGGNVRPFADMDTEVQSGAVHNLLAQTATQEFDITCEECIQTLPEELREFAVLRLFGHTNLEISEIIDCSQRRVERKLARIRELWTEAEHEDQ